MASVELSEKVEVFKRLKFHMKLIGILKFDLPLPYQRFPILFVQRFLIFVVLIESVLASFGYCLFEAKSTYDFIESFYMAMGFALVMVLYSVLLWKRDGIVHLFDVITGIIETRNMKLLRLIFLTEKKTNENQFCRN